jgi:hypothetical protein
MNRESSIAERIVSKTRKADFGDVELYFNVFDYVVTIDGSQMTPEQFEAAKSELNARSVYAEVDKFLRRKLNSIVTANGLKSIGLKPKR